MTIKEKLSQLNTGNIPTKDHNNNEENPQDIQHPNRKLRRLKDHTYTCINVSISNCNANKFPMKIK